MLMLTDTTPDFDHRVRDAWARQGQPALVVIPRRTPRAWRYLSALLALLLLPVLVLLLGRPVAKLGTRMKGSYGGLTSGLRAFALLQAASLHFFWAQRNVLRASGRLYAHDQMAGAVAWLACKAYGVPYVYDAHEIVPFRARQTGLARMLLEYAWECAIVRASERCCVVNRPMRRIYRHLYGPADYELRPNDFFPEQPAAVDPAGRRMIVYVGAIGRHRGIERMRMLAAAQGAEMLCFVSNARSAEAGLSGAEVLGLEGYAELLLQRAAGAAPYLWCAFDTDVPSYRHSLPNKFFQAMAMGLPVVALHGSYVGRLAARHGIGVVIGAEADAGVAMWSGTAYAQCMRAMAAFRAAYRRGEFAI
jgi:glycosyltransferase involved in cell wall biosynthesis